MVISYEMNTDGIRLKTVFVDKVTKDDIVNNYLNITIPATVDGEEIKIVGVQGYHLLQFSDDTNRFLVENAHRLMINIENGPSKIEDLKSPYKFIMKIFIPNSIEQIRFCAFANCNIEEIIFSEKAVKEICHSAFFNATFQEHFVFPKACISIGEHAFKNCNFLGGTSFSPDSNIQEIDEAAFKDASLYSDCFVMPISLRVISEKSFMGSKKVDKIVFPKNSKIYSIKSFAFANCSCKEIVFQNQSDIFMDEDIFQGSYRLEKIDMAALTNTELPSRLCYECKCLKDVSLPKNINVINTLTFADCGLSGKLSLPNTLTKIGWGAFKSNRLSEICFLDECNLNVIGEHAFFGNALKKLPENIFEQVRYCGAGAFAENLFESLKLMAPSLLGDFKQQIFHENRHLKSVELVNTKMNSWIKIPVAMFSNCSQLEEIIIPKTVLTLESYCFSNTSIDNVLLEGVYYIGEGSFSDCTNLKKCSILNQNKPLTINNLAFKGAVFLKELNFSPFCTGTIFAKAFPDWKLEDIRNVINNSTFIDIV